jgi:ABC-type nitrate/sulfonate/bicarbonate transport system permease component
MLKRLFKFGGSSDFGKVGNATITIVGFTVIILLWHLIAKNEIIPTKILPDPFKVIGSIGYLITENDLFQNLWYTVKLNLSSYLYAIIIAFPIAFILGIFPVFDVLFGKYASALRFIPCPSLIGIFVAIFGLTFTTKAAFLTFAIVIFMIPEIVNTIHDLQNPKNDKDNVYLQTAHTLGMTSWQKMRAQMWRQ